MHRLLYFFVLLSLVAASLSSCSPAAMRTRQWKRYTAELSQAAPLPPDSATGTYAPSDDLNLLDALLRRYPGRQQTRVVTETQTLTVPGKTVYVQLKARPDTVRNAATRDSLLVGLQALISEERADSEVRAEVARLRGALLRALNARACLPDTVVRFADYDLTLEIKRGQGGRYGFTWRKGPQSFSYDAKITQTQHGRLVVVPKPAYWRDKWFWLMLAFAGLAGWLGFLRLRDARPTGIR